MTITTLPPAAVRARWLVLAAILAAEVMDVLDSTVTTVIGPALRADLGASTTDLQWVLGGYPLVLGLGLVTGGRLGDRYGHRRMFLIAVSGFGLASLLCALAPDVRTLIAARCLQGLAGALLLPQGFAVLRTVFPGGEFGRAMAVFGPVLGGAAIAGPPLGGLLAAADVAGLGWRLAFLINVPISAAALAVARRHLPGPGPRPAAGRAPIVSRRILGNRPYAAGLAAMAFFFSCTIGMTFVLSLFLQLGKDFSVGGAGLAAVPFAAGTAIGSALSGIVLLPRLGRRSLQLGAVLQLAAAGGLWLLLGHDAPLTPMLATLAVAGLGNGMIIAALIEIIVSALDDADVGAGSGLLAAVQAVAAAAGVAGLSGLFFGAPDAVAGYRQAVVAQAVLTVLFLAVTAFLPARHRPGTAPERPAPAAGG